MVKKTVLKVDISCLKCKRKLLKIVSSLQGVDKIEADEGKGTLTVTGDADPYEIIVRIRKAGKHAEVVSVGPPRDPPVWHSLGLILIDESVSPIRVAIILGELQPPMKNLRSPLSPVSTCHITILLTNPSCTIL
ncbi:hypothetical protein D0Y65_001808 [Glycine soja]|uniref:HMA domain-containing protein n=1 Tax=Glycine soja TaxID=3848 RepID=A0A445M469_GLYSO|nr:hypothetical protein D0Y65_001808 [Glycine soja]